MKAGKLVSSISGAMVGCLAGGMSVKSILQKKIHKKNEMLEKMYMFYVLLNQWLSIRQEGRSLEEFFTEHNYNAIAIYGMKELGDRLYEELKDSGVSVKYAIDKNADFIYSEIDVVTPDADFESVDAIIVTAVYCFYEIEEILNKKTDIPVISLEDIIYEIYYSLT